MGTALVLAFILLALVAVIFSAANSLAGTHAPVPSLPQEPGVSARVICPRTLQPAAVKLGLSAANALLEVIWCEHYPSGKIDCGRGCFTSIARAGAPRLIFEGASLS